MKPIDSPLNIIDFAIINFELNFIQPKEKATVGVSEYFREYEIDIDFTIHNDEMIQVFLKADINRQKSKKPGYSIFAEVACIFEFNKSIEVTPEAKKAIEGFSTIYIALNCLRGFISQFTGSGPVGRYILPSIDLNDLIKKKQESLKIKKPASAKRKKNVLSKNVK